MASSDSVIDAEAIAYVRGLLKPPIRRERTWPALAAAAFAAFTALACAFTMLLAPAPHVAKQVADKPVSLSTP